MLTIAIEWNTHHSMHNFCCCCYSFWSMCLHNRFLFFLQQFFNVIVLLFFEFEYRCTITLFYLNTTVFNANFKLANNHNEASGKHKKVVLKSQHGVSTNVFAHSFVLQFLNINSIIWYWVHIIAESMIEIENWTICNYLLTWMTKTTVYIVIHSNKRRKKN